ncbi:MAG: hypothetical protein MMC33_008420 [Icmadophila ericetorum]|nr:hypothetical protein [Icmadophila ericetorum]
MGSKPPLSPSSAPRGGRIPMRFTVHKSDKREIESMLKQAPNFNDELEIILRFTPERLDDMEDYFRGAKEAYLRNGKEVYVRRETPTPNTPTPKSLAATSLPSIPEFKIHRKTIDSLSHTGGHSRSTSYDSRLTQNTTPSFNCGHTQMTSNSRQESRVTRKAANKDARLTTPSPSHESKSRLDASGPRSPSQIQLTTPLSWIPAGVRNRLSGRNLEIPASTVKLIDQPSSTSPLPSEQITSVSRQVKHLQDNMNSEFKKLALAIESSEWNQRARLHNSQVKWPDGYFMEIATSDYQVATKFPKTPLDLDELSEAEIDTLLQIYKIDTSGDVERKWRRWANFMGIYMEL